MMMGKNVATAVLVLAGTVGIASACDGPYIDKCDIDGCATGSYVCPAACQQKHVSSFNVSVDRSRARQRGCGAHEY